MSDMAGREYTLDFSGKSGVPSQMGINIEFVSRLFGQQAKGVDGIQLTSERRRGIFNVVALNTEAATFLSTFVLKVEKKGTPTVNIPLREKKRRGKPAVWIKFYGTCEGDMRMLANATFDDLLRESGVDVITPTRRQRYREAPSVFNGVREAFVEIGAEHVPRHQEWMSDDGVVHQFRIIYRGQPFDC